MSPLLQTLLVGLIVLVAAVNAFRRLAPGRAWQLQARLAFALERAPLLRRLGLLLRPRITPAAGCASSCARCTGCG
jgi:hypothetical protein